MYITDNDNDDKTNRTRQNTEQTLMAVLLARRFNIGGGGGGDSSRSGERTRWWRSGRRFSSFVREKRHGESAREIKCDDRRKTTRKNRIKKLYVREKKNKIIRTKKKNDNDSSSFISLFLVNTLRIDSVRSRPSWLASEKHIVTEQILE